LPVLQGSRTVAASTAARTARRRGTTAGDLKVCQFFYCRESESVTVLLPGDLKVCQFFYYRGSESVPVLLSGI
jgi:hypothetical protein